MIKMQTRHDHNLRSITKIIQTNATLISLLVQDPSIFTFFKASMEDLVDGSMKSVTGGVSKMAKLIGKNVWVLFNMLEAKERMSAVTVSMNFLGHST